MCFVCDVLYDVACVGVLSLAVFMCVFKAGCASCVVYCAILYSLFVLLFVRVVDQK